MANPLANLLESLQTLIWKDDLHQLSPTRRLLVQTLRVLYVLLRDLLAGELNLRAMSLVYTTLLSLVPLLALSFSVLKGFGVHNQIQPLLYRFLEPLGPKGVELAGHVVNFVENVKVGVLGTLGLIFLIYTVLSLLQKIEAAFNYVWRVERLRSLGQRFSSYLSVVLIGPVLVFASAGMTATVMSHELVRALAEIEPFGTLLLAASKLLPYVLVALAFTIVYIFIPNTRVRMIPAAIGGLVAGFLWHTAFWAFAAFIASSTKYTAIYSGFAILVLLLIWLYVNWLVLLLGSQIAFYVQHPQYVTQQRVRLVLSNRLKEQLALAVMYEVGRNHHLSRAPWTLEALAERLRVPAEPLARLLGMLQATGYLAETADEPPAFLPARDIATIGLYELLSDVRRADESRFVRPDRMLRLAPVEAVMERLEASWRDRLDGLTLGELVREGGQAEDA